MPTFAAADLGAQSGRVVLGRFDGRRLEIDEVHRFPNVPVEVGGTFHWDVLRLYRDVLDGLRKASEAAGGSVDSVGVDTWGVDFGLLDRAGRLLQNPVHHRDARSERGAEAALRRIGARELYERTGIQLMPINTVFQLSALVEDGDPVLEAADKLLLLPDLLHLWLSGTAACERTNATTTACFDPRAGGWARDLLARLGIPARLFPVIVDAGTPLGPMLADVGRDTGLQRTQVIAPATHDTASAVTAVPFRRPGSAYVSAGTWSLVGIETSSPLIDDRTFAANLTNEGGVAGTFRVLRNVTGLWLLHECRRAWTLEGHEWSFEDLVAMAERAPPLRSLVDPNDPSLAAPGDMPLRIRARCAAAGEPVPETPGELVRCVLESLALAHRRALELLRAAAGADPAEIHVVGGGCRNRLLCRWTADATGLPVLAGPEEATAIGNVALQAVALGAIGSVGEAREIVRASFAPAEYEPGDRSAWDDAYGRVYAASAAEAVVA